MANTKYNVLFMRDDDTVKRFRLSPMWLTFLGWIFFLLLVSAVCGSWAGYNYWNHNKVLVKEKNNLIRLNNEANIKLQSLENVNKILDNYDPSELQKMLVSVPVEEKSEKGVSMNLSKLLGYTDTMRVGVENVKARKSSRSLVLSFELNNLQTSTALSGDVKLEIITNSGTPINIKENRNDMSFHIQRFKVVRTRFAIPSKLDLKDVYGLRLMITTNKDELIFSEVYPLSHIYN